MKPHGVVQPLRFAYHAGHANPESGFAIGRVLCEVVRHTGQGAGLKFLAGFGSDLILDLMIEHNALG